MIAYDKEDLAEFVAYNVFKQRDQDVVASVIATDKNKLVSSITDDYLFSTNSGNLKLHAVSLLKNIQQNNQYFSYVNLMKHYKGNTFAVEEIENTGNETVLFLRLSIVDQRSNCVDHYIIPQSNGPWLHKRRPFDPQRPFSKSFLNTVIK